jgi:hypothetical protein
MPTITPPKISSNFGFLLVALFLLLLGLPLAEDLSLISVPVVRSVMFSLLLAIGIWSLKGGGTFFTFGMTFAVVGILLNLLAFNIESDFLATASQVILFGFLLVAIAYTFGEIALSTEMSTNRLLGAICVYLLLGTIWALGYSFIETLSPGSFHGIGDDADHSLNSDWIYFSFVTMTTLGYGDLLPLSATARALAYIQAVFGQFYIAILVAGLVSGYISTRKIEPGGP